MLLLLLLLKYLFCLSALQFLSLFALKTQGTTCKYSLQTNKHEQGGAGTGTETETAEGST